MQNTVSSIHHLLIAIFKSDHMSQLLYHSLNCCVSWNSYSDVHVSCTGCCKRRPPCLTPRRGSAGRCWGSWLPQEGRAAQSGLFWSVSSQSDYIRRLLWRLDSLLLPSLHYWESMCSSSSSSSSSSGGGGGSSSSSSWASLQHSRLRTPRLDQDTEAGDTRSHRPLDGPDHTVKKTNNAGLRAIMYINFKKGPLPHCCGKSTLQVFILWYITLNV